jgi:hypothetical protein
MSLTSCAVIGPNSSVEVLSPSNQVTETVLTARHYKSEEHCARALEVIPKNLLASLDPLSNEQRARLPWPERLRNYTPKQCRSFKKRGQILGELGEIFSEKNTRVGVILPESSPSEQAIQTILSQMKMQLATLGYSSEQTLVIRRVGKERVDALRSAAELVHLDRVAIIVGGLNANHASAITQIADQSQTPALIINAHAQLGITRQTMRVYPPIKRLATRLAENFKNNEVKTVTALFPMGANIDLYNLLRQELGGGYAFSQASYDPENPQSILNAVRSQASRLVGSSGRPAVLILDNFRMVRHIVNILATSLPDNKILFAGNQQWRSPALVIPREETLQGAIFVDFIGNYRNLPSSIETPISDNDYFTTAQAASKIDYQIIGHRLGSLAGEAARFGLSRHEIARRLQSISNRWDPYFPKSELAFDQKRESSWPVFLFQVTDEAIKEI